MKKVLLLVLLAVSIEAQTIRVTVDATDAPRKVFHARMTMPATPRLAFAKWLPGEHGPTGVIAVLSSSGENAELFRTHTVEYRGGLRDPHLVRVEGKEDRLGAVLAARAAARQ